MVVYCENGCPQSALSVLWQAEPITLLFTGLNSPFLSFQPVVAGVTGVFWVVVVLQGFLWMVSLEDPPQEAAVGCPNLFLVFTKVQH